MSIQRETTQTEKNLILQTIFSKSILTFVFQIEVDLGISWHLNVWFPKRLKAKISNANIFEKIAFILKSFTFKAWWEFNSYLFGSFLAKSSIFAWVYLWYSFRPKNKFSISFSFIVFHVDFDKWIHISHLKFSNERLLMMHY